eukprot:m.1206812 g.1206812  ORF g.1206812 m.1206812 type:complete len:307 (-) comp24586_c0_seq13:2173-3093(-)
MVPTPCSIGHWDNSKTDPTMELSRFGRISAQCKSATMTLAWWVVLIAAFKCTQAMSSVNLTFLRSYPLKLLGGNISTIEGGCVIELEGGSLGMFTTDTTHGIVNTRLVYLYASDRRSPFVYNSTLACCSTGNTSGKDNRASLWAPMPARGVDGEWNLFYVQYASAASNSSGWYSNFHGGVRCSYEVLEIRVKSSGSHFVMLLRECVNVQMFAGEIMHAVSVSGSVAGPYKDVGVVLRPDRMSQPLEGLQGTDSISPPYRLANGTYAAFYGSAHTETPIPHSWYTAARSRREYCFGNTNEAMTMVLV